MHILFVITTTDREDPDYVAFHQGLLYTVCYDKNDLQGKNCSFV